MNIKWDYTDNLGNYWNRKSIESINELKSKDEKIVEFVEFLLQVLQVDITYEEFNRMSIEERKSIIRDIKLNKILEK